MSAVQLLRAFVTQRLTVAAEEIIGVFERTISDYEEEIGRQSRLLAARKPEVQAHTTVFPPDIQLLVSEEEVPPEQQNWSPSLDQEDREPPHIKEEQEELWTSQEGEQHQGLTEAHITEFPFTPVPDMSEDDDEKPRSSQLQNHTEENREAEPLASSSTEQMKTEADREDCGVSEPARNLDPTSHLQPTSYGKTSHSSEPEKSDDEWKETREPHSYLDSLKNSEVIHHKRFHTGDEQLSCSVCGKKFVWKGNLQRHMRIHTGEKPFSCSVCKKRFRFGGDVGRHMRIHTMEKPFSCKVCGQRFSQSGAVIKHMSLHTGEKPFSCSVCGKSFSAKGNMKQHMVACKNQNLTFSFFDISMN